MASQSGHVCLCMPCVDLPYSCMTEFQLSTLKAEYRCWMHDREAAISQAGYLLPSHIKSISYMLWLLMAQLVMMVLAFMHSAVMLCFTKNPGPDKLADPEDSDACCSPGALYVLT